MSPEEITPHEPTAVKRDPNDQKIAEGRKTASTTNISSPALETTTPHALLSIVLTPFLDFEISSQSKNLLINTHCCKYI